MNEAQAIKERIAYCQRMAKYCKQRGELDAHFFFLGRATRLEYRLRKLIKEAA